MACEVTAVFTQVYNLNDIVVDITIRSLPLRVTSPRPYPFSNVATAITVTKLSFGSLLVVY